MKNKKENVYLVYVISQHEGYCDTEVYKTSETACDAAEQLIFEYEQDGYAIMPNYTNINFARDIISGCCSIRVENENDEVEITVEKKIVR